MPHDLTQAELDSLSPEERKAVLEGGDDPPPTVDDGEPDAHHSLGAGNPHSEEEDPPPATPPATPPADKPTDGAAAEGGDGEPAGEEPFAVPYQYDPAGFDLKAAEAAVADLDAKFREGEIDLEEYNRERDKIREEITTHKVAAKISVEMGSQTALAKWQANVDAFLAQEANAMYSQDKIKYIALNETVKSLARDPKNSNKSEVWLLKEADRLVRASLGSAAAPKPLSPKDAAMRARLPSGGLPPNLGDIPNAAPESDDAGEFAGIDALLDGTPDGQQRYERALAKMSREQQERYLAG